MLDSEPGEPARSASRSPSLWFKVRARIRNLLDWSTDHPRKATALALVTTCSVFALEWAIFEALDAASAGVAKVVAAPDPLKTTVILRPVDYRKQNYVPFGVLFPRPHDEVEIPEDAFIGEDSWAYDMGAIDAGTTQVEIILQGDGDTPVILRGLDIRVLARRTPLEGTYLEWLGGDLLDIRYIDVDLDQNPPTLDEGNCCLAELTKWSFPLRVTSTEPEVIFVTAKTDSCDCSWVADLRYVYEGEERVLTIDNEGEPFRTTATGNAEHVLLEQGHRSLPPNR